MARAVGYYVHHHGAGHLERALAIARQADDRLTLLGTGLKGRAHDLDVVDLPDDRLGGGAFDGRDGVERPTCLHYAPLDHDGVRRRVADIARWIANHRPALMVVDVSVEVAMLARLASTPTVYVRLSGRRFDRPHLETFASAAGLLAPFHPALEDDGVPCDVRRKTFYAPGMVARSAAPARGGAHAGILGVVGRGGDVSDGERWASAARAAPNLVWRVIGPCTIPRGAPSNLHVLGWVGDAAERIAGADVVVGGAGDGLVGSVIAARRPFICIPEARPFDEQRSKAAALGALGAAIVCTEWPSEVEWPSLIGRARGLDTAVLGELDVTDGARRAAAWILQLAEPQGPLTRDSA